MNKDIIIHGMGIKTSHDYNTVINRPNGINDYIIMNFLNPFFIKTIEGIYNGTGGECIIHSKLFHEYHGSEPSAKEGFRNNWIVFSSKYLDSLMYNYGLDFDKIYKMPNDNSLTKLFQELQDEFLDKKFFYRENVSLIIEKLLLNISRNQKHDHMMSNLTKNEIAYFYSIQNIRQNVLTNFPDKWTVKKMSKLANISESRFLVLYKKFFFCSPIDELITRRINHARAMLLDTNNTIDEISQLCGFVSQSYFSKMFKNKVGLAPQNFRLP